MTSSENNSSSSPFTAMNEDFAQLDLNGKIIIKAEYGDDIRKIPILNDELTYDELVLMMIRLFRLQSTDEIDIKYRDEDNDLISILDSNDLSFAIQCSRLLKLKLTVNSKTANCSINERRAIRDELITIRNRCIDLLDKLDLGGLSEINDSTTIADNLVSETSSLISKVSNLDLSGDNNKQQQPQLTAKRSLPGNDPSIKTESDSSDSNAKKPVHEIPASFGGLSDNQPQPQQQQPQHQQQQQSAPFAQKTYPTNAPFRLPSSVNQQQFSGSVPGSGPSTGTSATSSSNASGAGAGGPVFQAPPPPPFSQASSFNLPPSQQSFSGPPPQSFSGPPPQSFSGPPPPPGVPSISSKQQQQPLYLPQQQQPFPPNFQVPLPPTSQFGPPPSAPGFQPPPPTSQQQQFIPPPPQSLAGTAGLQRNQVGAPPPTHSYQQYQPGPPQQPPPGSLGSKPSTPIGGLNQGQSGQPPPPMGAMVPQPQPPPPGMIPPPPQGHQLPQQQQQQPQQPPPLGPPPGGLPPQGLQQQQFGMPPPQMRYLSNPYMSPPSSEH